MRMYLSVIPFVVAGVMLAGCSNDSDSTSPTSTADTPTVTVTVSPPVSQPTVAPPLVTDSPTAEKMRPPACKPNEVDPRCWDTARDTGGVLMAPEDDGRVFDVSPSSDWSHGYDVIVFNVGSLTDVQFEAEYVDPPNRITTEGKGDPVDLFGMADLRLTIHALPADGVIGYEYRGSMDDYGVLRHIKYAGAQHRQTTFGIGVDHKVPFAVMSGPGGSSGTDKVIVYLAHE